MITPLRKIRELRQVTRKAFAAELGVDPSYYRRIEIAEITPTPEMAAKIAGQLRIDERQILYPERYTNPSPTAPSPEVTA